MRCALSKWPIILSTVSVPLEPLPPRQGRILFHPLGVVTIGRRFTIRAIWWTDDKNTIGSNCAMFIKRYLDSHTPKEQYRPYILSGQEAGQGNPLTLKSIDTCVPKAPNFGVPDKNVFK